MSSSADDWCRVECLTLVSIEVSLATRSRPQAPLSSVCTPTGPLAGVDRVRLRAEFSPTWRCGARRPTVLVSVVLSARLSAKLVGEDLVKAGGSGSAWSGAGRLVEDFVDGGGLKGESNEQLCGGVCGVIAASSGDPWCELATDEVDLAPPFVVADVAVPRSEVLVDDAGEQRCGAGGDGGAEYF